MQPDSHRDRIIEAMRINSRPLDDDQLADRTGFSPRQSVNQICRELERAGMVRRRPGPDGKIVNEWLGNRGRQSYTVARTSGAGVSQTAAVTEVAGARSWAARAFQDLGVTISVVDLPVDLRQNLLQAQRRQYR